MVHLIARELSDFTPALLAVADGHDIGSAALARVTGAHGPLPLASRPAARAAQPDEAAMRAALPAGRNFH
ncbi:hypothetical protein [Breoghania sp. L-A4]|uniref:hypothetical protein n=1 Tax=Breoghania sp. L-A4 TaxID=2304600 RepID=UPI0020BD62C3|nr:hypothetical protein [Breoghania sp. L-A4]